MKITLLISDTSIKSFPRTKLLYNLLKPNFELEVIAVSNKTEEANLFRENFPNLKIIKYNLGTIIADLNKNITGDVIYAMRAKPTSFGFAMSLKVQKKLPVIVDIDSKELYNCYPYSQSFAKNFIFSLLGFSNPNSFIYTWLIEKRIKYSDHITVASTELQKLYTGVFIPSACDTELFNQALYKKDEIKAYMGWNELKVILFAGTVDHNVDLDLLINSVKALNRNDIKIAIVGNNNKLKKLAEKESLITLAGFQPQLNIAKLLSACDLVVLPQKNMDLNLPVKLFEAMSSEKPIISLNFSGIENILEDCGYICENSEQVTSKIKILLEDENLAKELGLKARQKVLDKYSKKTMEDKLKDFFNKFNLNIK